MDLSQLKLNRYLQKEPSQADQTKDSVFNSVNPLQKKGDKDGEKRGGTENNKEDNGAENIITGTVITSCLIQTSGLPSRIELEGNDLTFYDDTVLRSGKVVGDTARLSFTHDQNSGEGFIMEKRASVFDTYDNVLSWYASPAKNGRNNYMFIGRNATLLDPQRNVNYIEMSVNSISNVGVDDKNGFLRMKLSIDGVEKRGDIEIFDIASRAAGFTGVGANCFGSGDQSLNDIGYGAVAYLSSATGSALSTVEANKNGVKMTGLPTSSAGLTTGQVWRNGTVLNIIA